MLVIRVVSFRGRPADQGMFARFSEAGGTLGRGEASTLVLPDPDRYISRTHATISFQAQGFVITDNSTKNPIILNGRPMGPGSQARLSDGDELNLGGYVLAVTVAAPRVPSPPPAEIWPASASGQPIANPVAARGGPPSSGPDPFADLPRSLGPERYERRQGPEPVIPNSPAVSPDPLIGLHGREPSVDEVLGLKSSGSADPLRPEGAQSRPFPESDPMRGVDPFEFLGGAARPIPPPTVPDHGQEIFTPYVPPVAKADPAHQIPWEAVLPAAQPAASPQPPVIPADVARGPVVGSPVVGPPVVGPSGASPRVASPPVTGAPVVAPDHAALLHAFLGGAGIPEAQLPAGLTPETMEAIGKLLRAAVQGTLDLLRVRGITKSEMRADVTMIMPLDNNPLKFSPSVEAALVHLLAPHMRGFVPPLRAMKEAYDDLRAHQLAFLAGMRAALEEVLARFEPEQLQKRLSDPTVLDNLLPMNRRAKQWDLFVERYEEVAGDARENFNAAFGNAFRRAYEAQVKQLRAEGR